MSDLIGFLAALGVLALLLGGWLYVFRALALRQHAPSMDLNMGNPRKIRKIQVIHGVAPDGASLR